MSARVVLSVEILTSGDIKFECHTKYHASRVSSYDHRMLKFGISETFKSVSFGNAKMGGIYITQDSIIVINCHLTALRPITGVRRPSIRRWLYDSLI